MKPAATLFISSALVLLSCGIRSGAQFASPPQVYVLEIFGEPFSRKVLAASLQGIVNKKGPRIYIVDGEAGENRPWEKSMEHQSQLFWLDVYRERVGLETAWEGGLADALKLFSPEISGYILIAETEPWSINAATSLAGRKKALVVFENDLPMVEALGLPLLEDLRGRWKDARTCYSDLFKTIYPTLSHTALGVLNPKEHRVRDLLIQRNILTVYARPSSEDWDLIEDIFNKTPQNIPIFGYMSAEMVEEFPAVKALSKAGKYLVPSDTTSNLSFHGSFKVRFKPGPPSHKVSCTPGRLYVSAAISDGDNLAIPLNIYPDEKYWQASNRGEIPMGWSLSMALRHIAPIVADYYISTAGEKDELVGMLGMGYVYPSFYSDTGFLMKESLESISAMGMTSWWQIDFSLYSPKDPAWEKMSQYLEGNPLRGFLIGYMSSGGKGGTFRIPSGHPVLLTSTIAYGDNPKAMASRIRNEARSINKDEVKILFFSASVWTNNFHDMRNALREFDNDPRIVLLLPSQTLDCAAD